MLRNIHFLFLVTLVLIFSVYKVFAQSNSNPFPTPTNFVPRTLEYPTPDWKRLWGRICLLYTSRLVLMKNGKIEADGKPNKVLTPPRIQSVLNVEVDLLKDRKKMSYFVPKVQKAVKN